MKSVRALILLLAFPVLPGLMAGTITYPITTNVMISLTSWSVTGANYDQTQIYINGYDGKYIYYFNTDRSSFTDHITLYNSSLTIVFKFYISKTNTYDSYTTSATLYNGEGSGSLSVNSANTSGSLQYTVKLCPTPPYLTIANGRHCYNDIIDITAVSKPDYNDTTKISYNWEYLVGSSNTWTKLGLTSGTLSTLHFSPVHDSSSINKRTTFSFRAVANDYGSGCIGLNSYASAMTTVLPPPPSAILDTSTFTKSCPDPGKTGQIMVSNIRSVVNTQDYTWRITKASTPDLTSIDLQNGYDDLPVNFTGNNLTISNISPGEQKLYLTYKDPTINNCLSPIPFTIKSFPELSYTASTNDCACPEKADGSITISINQVAGNYNYILKNESGLNINRLNNLPVSNNYLLTLNDACTTKSKTLTISAPPAVTITDTISKKPNCIDPANGTITVIASCASNTYHYRIYPGTDTQMTNPVIDAPGQGPSWTINTLPAGNYIVNVRNNNLPNCTGAFVNMTLKPVDTLKTSISNITKVNCFGENHGALTAKALGGQTGGYVYHLSSLAGFSKDSSSTNHSIPFENLFAGQYTLQVKNANSLCKDAATASDSIKTNREVLIELKPQDITCHNDSNGRITTTLSYGSGSYDHYWYKKDPESGEWDQPLNFPLSLTSLPHGDYRLSAWDSLYNCNAVYDSVTIHEPAPVVFDSLKLNNIVCIGDSANIFMRAKGGNGGYTFQDSTNNTPWKTYIPGSTLKPSTYRLRVRDAKLCTTLYHVPITISAPPDTFKFTYTLSNYNGFQVTCFGNNNGWIKINPSGGNGGTYSGYQSQYRTNGNWFTTDSLKGLTAGNYNLTVKDARGCAKTQLVTLKQPTSQINLAISSQRARCFTDATGSISVSAYGGTEPYTFRIGNGNYGTIKTFNNLAAGKYQVAAKDTNGCLQISGVELTSQSPEIIITGSVVNEKCNGRKEGSIVPVISGGLTPCTWIWNETGSNQLEQLYLAKGFYTLKVTDALNCVTEHRFEVAEPEALTVSSTAKPVCAGTDTGIVRTSASGGTPPYLYAVDQMSWLSKNTEIPADAGTHNVYAVDANNCIAVMEQTVAIRNTKPWVDFLVATSRYATDSLEIIDVSWPVPDSIKWIFAPEAKVISNNSNSVCIKFETPGIYPVTMTGYFSGCDYSRETPITVAPYDPNAYADTKKQNGFEKLTISPNPNTGFFKVAYKLYPKQRVCIKVVDMYSTLWYSKVIEPTMEGEQSIQMPNAPSSSYILTVVSENDAKSAGFIISK